MNDTKSGARPAAWLARHDPCRPAYVSLITSRCGISHSEETMTVRRYPCRGCDGTVVGNLLPRGRMKRYRGMVRSVVAGAVLVADAIATRRTTTPQPSSSRDCTQADSLVRLTAPSCPSVFADCVPHEPKSMPRAPQLALCHGKYRLGSRLRNLWLDQTTDGSLTDCMCDPTP
ncbi:uncharacterized protein B0I36DRAFT_333860 [Microdochium trichocladiopsis]|uniref:Uncharacterized protein n=1 Tax=Microdochium trichocladiopsis TaxID=1682393 RepID=A0A9P9BKE9_9PEZI|nr:uncharacterized protein B0I36DRAFT_333860 [Microdochium trichocladiopsis]KAH7021149.1 hypothetical protein B0I36DRAFT_333860 [Microdochium trichocladiopsis]